MDQDYCFTLLFSVPDTVDISELVERLGAAGCTDALVGIGVIGRVALHFTRQGRTLESAQQTAIADVLSALPNAQLLGTRNECGVGPSSG